MNEIFSKLEFCRAEKLTEEQWKQLGNLKGGNKIIKEKIEYFLLEITSPFGSSAETVKDLMEKLFKEIKYPTKTFNHLEVEINYGQIFFKGTILSPDGSSIISFYN